MVGIAARYCAIADLYQIADIALNVAIFRPRGTGEIASETLI